jgi:hypothetical protein
MEETHLGKFSPPVYRTSETLIAVSTAIIKINNIPVVVQMTFLRPTWLLRMTGLKRIDVIKPFTIAKTIIATTGQSNPLSWKQGIFHAFLQVKAIHL